MHYTCYTMTYENMSNMYNYIVSIISIIYICVRVLDY